MALHARTSAAREPETELFSLLTHDAERTLADTSARILARRADEPAVGVLVIDGASHSA